MSNQEYQWTMPKWMRPYTNVIVQGETAEYVEKMVNDKTAIQINAPKALMAVEIGGRVQMLTRLHKEGLLESYDPERVC